MAGNKTKLGSRSVVLACVCFCLGAMATSAETASGSSWSGFQLPGEAAKVAMFSVACPTASLCVAVGGNNTIATSTNPTGGQPAWNVVYAGEGATPTGSNFRQVRGISCASPQFCVAVTFEGLIYTSTNPTGGAESWAVTDIDGEGPNTHLYGISCPSPSFCAASAGGAEVVTSTDPTGGAAAWVKTQLEGPLELRGISCASAALCVAVGDNGDSIRPDVTDQATVVGSASPLGGLWSPASLPGRQSLYGVSCPSPSLCVSGDTLGNLLVATNPVGGTAAWRTIGGSGSVQITDVDCGSSSLCAAVDNNGDVLTSTNPGGGPSDWTFTNLVPFPGAGSGAANAMFGVACPSRALCAVAANDGQIFTSTDPFAVPAPGDGGTEDKRARKKQPKRPRTVIAAQPMPALELGRPKLTARFRFYARDHVQVRGFACKFDGRPLRRCSSPKAYRVGLGRHVFRVRAIGWSGLKGPIEVARFRVCRPTPYPNCMRHLPPPTPGG